jgi:meiotic recombination protein SPO11
MWYANLGDMSGSTANDLSQTAAAKGLLAGNFRLVRYDGHLVDGMSEKEVGQCPRARDASLTTCQGMLVPNVSENDSVDLTEVHWVLIIEKEV